MSSTASGLPQRDGDQDDGIGISLASRRLRALSVLSGSLTDALEPKDAADLVEQKALSALDATSAVVVTLGAFPPIAGVVAQGVPNTLHVVHATGLPSEMTAALDQLPLGAPNPFAEVARDGRPLFMHSEHEMKRYPDWASAMIDTGARAAAIVPVWANGELRGVLGLAWSDPHIFDDDETAFVLTLGVMCAQAIMRAHLRAAEHTARKEAEAARVIAEEANRSKSRFVATISHELRTPMNAVLGYTSLIENEMCGPVSALQKEHLGRVRATGEHLVSLIGDLLGFARLESGEETVHPEPVQLAEVVEQSLVLVGPLAEKRGLRIRLEGPPQPIQLHTDPRKLRQILVNLLANAVKFTEVGEVVLVFRIEGTGAEIRIVIQVTDTGRGIASTDLEHIFDPFWRADPRSTDADGSSGLGLSVARQLARLLGGDVTVSSVVGEGSTFVVSLPVDYHQPVGTSNGESVGASVAG